MKLATAKSEEGVFGAVVDGDQLFPLPDGGPTGSFFEDDGVIPW